MKQILLCLCLMALNFQCPGQNQSYQNPVIPGFYPDPSVCRNGSDFYLVTSSFQFFPGVPVFHSKDLIHWEQIGHCLTRDSQLPLQNAWTSGGIFAPTIRFHHGLYYMVTTNVSGGGNFYVTAANPAGPWSEPIWVKQEGIDPTLFFDENERNYFMSTGNQGITLSEIETVSGKLTGSPKVIWNGTGGRYPEAPHIYKINGWYYLMIAEGGTEYGHMETIARSKSIWGPYESNPENPIITHRNYTGQNNPIQGTGHADLIQAEDNSWWLVFLAFRPAGGTFHHLGRETFLMPVQWNSDGWPFINSADTASLKVNTKTLPLFTVPIQNSRDDFDKPLLEFPWNYIRNPDLSKYSLTLNPGKLLLWGTKTSLNDRSNPTFIGRRQQHFNFVADTEIEFSAQDGEEAGLSVYMDENHHYDLVLTSENNKPVVFLRLKIGSMEHIEKKIPLEKQKIILSVSGTPTLYQFGFKYTEQDALTSLGGIETRYLSSEVAGGFTGVYIGLYSSGKKDSNKNPASFSWFDYIPMGN